MRTLQRFFATAIVVAIPGCAEKSTGPEACLPSTNFVFATVNVGTTVTFDWTPGCAVFLLRVESDVSDEWGIGGQEFANVIAPPITYGQTPPSGALEGPSPRALVSGQTYTLVLWRVLPEGSTIQCQERIERMCLVAEKAFQR